jgi:drug/metabolite transporter (DMT)-like permease
MAESTPRRSAHPNLSKGYAAVFATVVIWSMPSLFQYYLIAYYDPWTQNFYRYGIACVAILPFVFYRSWHQEWWLDRQAIVACFWPCLPNVVHQVTQVIALYYMGPGVYAIFTRSSVIFTALLALIFFREERHIIKQWQFQAGTLLGLIGAFGVIWFQSGWQSGHIPLPGLLVAFTATFCWALYGVLVKRPSAKLGSIRSFGLVSFITSALLLPLTFLFGDMAAPFRMSAHVNWILIISAVTCITLAHVLYYVAIREIGVALAQTLQLLCPIGAMALAAWIFGERLTQPQLYCAAILLLGAFLAMRVKPAAAVETAENL